MTIAPISSGSMALTLPSRPRIGQYPSPDGIGAAAQRLGYTRGSLKQRLWGERNAIELVAVTCEELVKAGQTPVALRIRYTIDTACAILRARDLRDLLHEEQELDGPEDTAQLALVEDLQDPAAKDTYRRRLLRYRALIDELLVALAPVPA